MKLRHFAWRTKFVLKSSCGSQVMWLTDFWLLNNGQCSDDVIFVCKLITVFRVQNNENGAGIGPFVKIKNRLNVFSNRKLKNFRSAPLQIALCCYFMYEELDAAIFSGVAVMVLTIPINTVVAKVSRKYQLEQMKNKDKRTKLMNEIIGGVKVSQICSTFCKAT